VSDELFLVCALADAPLTVSGSSFKHHCSKCHRRVMVAPSGMQLLRERRELAILCLTCFRRLKNPQLGDLNAEQIAEAMQPSVPNSWKERN
jgi:hypothetical protein